LTSAVRDTAGGESKARTSIGSAAAIRQLFRTVAKTALRPIEEEPAPPRRRSGETDKKAFRLAAKTVLRRVVQIPADAYAATTLYLAETLDWLNLWEANSLHDGGDLDSDNNTKQNYSSPHL
jgi:hypothetical protein